MCLFFRTKRLLVDPNPLRLLGKQHDVPLRRQRACFGHEDRRLPTVSLRLLCGRPNLLPHVLSSTGRNRQTPRPPDRFLLFQFHQLSQIFELRNLRVHQGQLRKSAAGTSTYEIPPVYHDGPGDQGHEGQCPGRPKHR